MIQEIFERLASEIDNPTTELEYTNNYTLLVAVILSAQATDVSVNKATKTLFAKYDTPEKMLILGEQSLREYIKSIGLNKGKAKNVILMSKRLVAEYSSQVPDNIEDLVSLPGVGRKTANVILNTLFDKPVIAVDTHVFRVSHRLGLVDENATTPDKVEKQLHEVIPKEYLKTAHHLLILHGRYVCKAKKPLCASCVLADICPSAKLYL